MENTGSVVYQLTHPNFLTRVSGNLILIGIVAICIWLLYRNATKPILPPKKPQKDMIINKHTGPDGMELEEYYRRKRNGEFKD